MRPGDGQPLRIKRGRQIGYRLDKLERQQFRALPKLQHSWDKVVLINPLAPHEAFEI